MIIETDSDLYDSTYWGNIYLDGIDHFLRTPRDVIRLVNVLSISFPGVAGEVNPVDFVAFETLRIFVPYVYSTIRTDGKYFYGSISSTQESASRNELEQFHQKWLEEVNEKDRGPIKDMLKRLFPKLEYAFGGSLYGSDWESEWRRKRRICSEAIFSIYLNLAIPDESIPRKEMLRILEKANNYNALSLEIGKLAIEIRKDGTSKAREFLNNL